MGQAHFELTGFFVYTLSLSDKKFGNPPMELAKSYTDLIESLKLEIQQARIKAHLAVNKELILLYWNIGRKILQQKEQEGWGTKVIKQIARDLQTAFPGMRGFSERNLVYMQTFAKSYPDFQFTQALPAQITWYHNTTILDKITNHEQRSWYIKSTIEHGWSRNVLVHQIETNLYERQGKSLNNFKDTLPSSQSELVQQILKNPYNLEFISVDNEAKERDIEKALIIKLKDFLIELGTGFAFLGNQYHVELEGQDFYMDLLFYHVKLKNYVVIELKNTAFKPEYAGKLNFYINLVDKRIKDEQDNPTIGLLLCKEKGNLIVDYAIEGISKPMGVSEYNITRTLPDELKDQLPGLEEISRRLDGLVEGVAARTPDKCL